MGLLTFTSKGIYCAQADVYIDPWRPVDKALITHGHADHARWGNKYYLCHPLTAAIIRHRISPDLNIEEVGYGEVVSINGVNFSFHPAGHVIGSAQIRVEYKGEVWVASGDYKTEGDGLSTPLEIVPCHTFITECTFGLPVYQWKPQTRIFNELNQWWQENVANHQPSIIYGYSLGKAQRIIHHLDENIGPIYTHGAVENINEVFRTEGIELKSTERITKNTDYSLLNEAIIVAPPSTQGSAWSKKIKNAVHATASGWMTLRGARRRSGVDKGFVISDHADWNGLNETIKSCGAERVIATHGYTNIFAKWLNSQGIEAITQETDFVGETLDQESE